jgi:hypothetical protein
MLLAAGFASAYGLELLATVHWIAVREASTLQADGVTGIKQRIGIWSDREGRLFTEAHVAKAADHLRRLGWLPPV